MLEAQQVITITVTKCVISFNTILYRGPVYPVLYNSILSRFSLEHRCCTE